MAAPMAVSSWITACPLSVTCLSASDGTGTKAAYLVVDNDLEVQSIIIHDLLDGLEVTPC